MGSLPRIRTLKVVDSKGAPGHIPLSSISIITKYEKLPNTYVVVASGIPEAVFAEEKEVIFYFDLDDAYTTVNKEQKS